MKNILYISVCIQIKKHIKMTAKMNLFDARLNRGFSQKDISDGTGITPVTISRIESGLIYPRESTKKRLEAMLGCELIFDAEKKPIGRPKKMKRKH